MSEVTWMERDVNPITKLDYPDVDVIRVENTYYMVSTTMHFMPGCEILRSYDLIHWEHATYVYDSLACIICNKAHIEYTLMATKACCPHSFSVNVLILLKPLP